MGPKCRSLLTNVGLLTEGFIEHPLYQCIEGCDYFVPIVLVFPYVVKSGFILLYVKLCRLLQCGRPVSNGRFTGGLSLGDVYKKIVKATARISCYVVSYDRG